ncbi:serine/threonine-protein kinase [Neobacillus bataviensis]|uniref:serine/threonine-protein kinase n=2 Tax=Bacteria TaxID=2 RepID=UPI001CBCFEAC|nr:serine/threonine-protein kinase [Neobacillus bataviensis]
MIKVNHVKPQLSLDQWKPIGAVEGRNSEVWIARDTQLEQVLILKKITKKSLDKQNVEDYFSEAKILNESNHPHIMPIFYSAEDEENVYITMPYYNNGSLNTIIDSASLTIREIIKYSLDFLSGLLFIHIKGLLHLDIKPTNIIINDIDRAVLTDFGLSKYLDENGFADQEWQYVQHRSPESYTTSKKTVLDDIYQAGLTLYRLCNGNEEFKIQFENLKLKHHADHSKMMKSITKGEFPNRKKYLPHIPVKLRRIINKMIHPDVNIRYQDVLSIINDLSKIGETLDWKCGIIKREQEFEFVYDNGKSVITINLIQSSNKYLTSGTKYIYESKKRTNVNKVKKTHNSLEKAFEFLENNFPKYS